MKAQCCFRTNSCVRLCIRCESNICKRREYYNSAWFGAKSTSLSRSDHSTFKGHALCIIKLFKEGSHIASKLATCIWHVLYGKKKGLVQEKNNGFLDKLSALHLIRITSVIANSFPRIRHYFSKIYFLNWFEKWSTPYALSQSVSHL